jgi:hypothetical protein
MSNVSPSTTLAWPTKSFAEAALNSNRIINMTGVRCVLMSFGISGYRKLRGLNFGQFWSGFSDSRFSGRSG